MTEKTEVVAEGEVARAIAGRKQQHPSINSSSELSEAWTRNQNGFRSQSKSPRLSFWPRRSCWGSLAASLAAHLCS